MLWLWIEHRTFRSSVWRSPNWAIKAGERQYASTINQPWTDDYNSTIIIYIMWQLNNHDTFFLLSRSLVLSARPTNIYCPCHLSNLLPHRALICSWWAHPHGKMLSNIPYIMEKCQMARPMSHPALHTNQNMILLCFLVHKWSWWSLPNNVSWTGCSCIYLMGDKKYSTHIWNYSWTPNHRFFA